MLENEKVDEYFTNASPKTENEHDDES